jgi:hypothetical protein
LDTQVLERGAEKILFVDAGLGELNTDSDFYRLLTLCQEKEIDKLLLDAHSLPPGFFNPHTGRAEEVLRRFTQANIGIALVTSIEQLNNDHFETILGLSLRYKFHVSYTHQQAEQWLINE